MRRFVLIAAAVLGTAAPHAHAQDADGKDEIQARALFVEANKRFDKGDFAGAAELFEEAYRRFPDNPKILLNLGTTYGKINRNAAAANAYQRYLDHAKADRSKLAAVKKSLSELDRKVAILEVEIEEPGARVRLDGEEIGQAPQKISRRVEVGPHLVAAEKEGFTPSQATVTLAVGETRAIQLRLVARPPEPAPVPEAGPVVAVAGQEPGMSDVQQRMAILHGGQLGAFVRVDMDGNDPGSGAVVAVGGSYGVLSNLDVEAAALLGAHFGAWVGASLYLGGGEWKPLLTAGVPVYFLDEKTLFAAHGAVGVEWNANTHLAVTLAAGVQYYVDPPMGIVNAAFVPSLAVSYRH